MIFEPPPPGVERVMTVCQCGHELLQMCPLDSAKQGECTYCGKRYHCVLNEAGSAWYRGKEEPVFWPAWVPVEP